MSASRNIEMCTDAAISRVNRRPGVAIFFVFLLGLGALCLAAGEPAADITRVAWGSVGQAYIFLVPIVVVYLVLVRGSALVGTESRRGASWGVLLACIGVGVGLFGQDRDILVLWQASPIVCFLSLLLSVRGLAWFRGRLPALVLLFAMVPVPGAIRQVFSQPLQGLATSLTASALDTIGVSAVRVWNLIEIRGVQVAVGEACDGMRLLMPLFIVMYAFVYSIPLSRSMRCVMLALCAPVALLSNVLRLVPVSLSYGFWPEHADWVHDLAGWLMIPLAILMLIGLLRFIEWLDLPVSRFRLAVS